MNDEATKSKVKSQRQKLAIWDWNGTLFDDMHATHIATNACLEFFDKPPITREIEQETFTFPLIHFYEKMGVNADEYLEKAEEAGLVFINSYNAHKKDCTLTTYAEEILYWLRDHGVTNMILSNNMQPVLDEDVKKLGIYHLFDTVSGNENPATIVQGLSKQKRLEDYIRQNNFTPENCFIIGDSHEEPEIAHRLDLLGISISGGLLSPARLQKYKKDFVIDCLSELIEILEEKWELKPISLV